MSTQVRTQMKQPTVVLGIGSTGLSCARYLYQRRMPFCVADSRELPPGLEQLKNDCPGVDIHLGGFDAELLLAAEQLIVSPGISLEQPAIKLARDAGVKAIGDIDLFCKQALAPVIGITGSNAKSTVTDLLGQMAQRAGRKVGIGGNLGKPALALLADDVELYVVELSSFQLERAHELGLSLATVLNLSEDHMDRHGDIENYARAKHRIFVGAKSVIINRDDDYSAPDDPSLVIGGFGLQVPPAEQFGVRCAEGVEYLARGNQLLLPLSELVLQGRHNAANALACLALGDAVDLPMSAMLEVLRSYTGLPHRCELVGQINGVRYVNDSKATNVGAAVAALQGLSTGKNIILIAGGQGKGADFDALRQPVEQSCKAVFLLGEDAASIHSALKGAADIQNVTSMTQAVAAAFALAQSGDLVLLSPACASFDMFVSFTHRGDSFRTGVSQLMQVEARK